MTPRWSGWATLVTVALRRDRILATAWILALTLLVYASAAATPGIYPTPADRVAAARALNSSAATVALYGPIVDVHSVGELAMTKLTVLYASFVAALTVVLVRRHTRTDEEAGRAEMLGATGVGRDAPLVAALAVAALASLVTGTLAAGADVVAGLPMTGSLAFGAGWAGTGLVAAALTALCCQLAASSRTCGGLVVAGLATLYVVRSLADVAQPGWGWLTVFGWGTRLHAWSQPRWWVLALYLATAGVLAGCALALRARRDLGAGLVRPRPGRPVARSYLATTSGLSWRLNRAAIGWWTIAVATFGAVFGFMVPGMADLLDTSAGRRMLEEIGGRGGLTDALLAAMFTISALVVTGFGIAVVARGDADERGGRAAPVLVATGSRAGLLLAQAATAGAGSAWLLAALGAAAGIGSGVGPVDGGLAALTQVPAVWLVVAVTALLYGAHPGWSVMGWGILAGCVALESFGALLGLPGWLTTLSPYAHTADLPVEPFAVLPTLVLSLLSVAVVSVAIAAYRRRDIT